jgi:UDP-3-O-acyl-N-acetylglucosamine deacetylase
MCAGTAACTTGSRVRCDMLSATIAHPVRIEGRGIFSGAPCAVELEPAPSGSGVTFIKDGVRIAAHPRNYLEGPQTQNTTAFGADGAVVSMTEHLMAALWCAGIDTVDVRCEGPELPNVDGSALLYYDALAMARHSLSTKRHMLVLEHPLRVEREAQQESSVESSIELKPHTQFAIVYDFSHPELGEQRCTSALTREFVAAEILPARTFITQAEAEQLQAAGILRNEDESSALVIRDGVPNSPLRFENEYARHKVLDLLGDLACLPFDIQGQLWAIHSGHALNRALARKLLEVDR